MIQNNKVGGYLQPQTVQQNTDSSNSTQLIIVTLKAAFFQLAARLREEGDNSRSFKIHPMLSLSDFANKTEQVQWLARRPAHDDKTSSLTINDVLEVA